ncbi:hypothetical protein ACFYZB_16645 [Streptomyces sp. NPDC001852]|uniref:hypothetical protein n=1 Tax=Streptomyces sp. NPDC001852 TaxID=3364619 RepID=UPI00367E4DDC
MSDRSLAGVDISTAIIQALAWSGATEPAVAAIEELSGKLADFPLGTRFLSRASAVAAEGLWAHDPEAAERLVDRFLAGTPRPSVPRAAHSIDPDAVFRVRDVVFAHMGLSE